ncbi:MAG: hypothetical protein KKB81_00490 [Candidatus Margulisbacteria bacterium]|nr:hypothetical protein [Candidatus Margulisiibacteriota bacterium]MBU1022301.1 hypothetical protein [Candidatus Margulisiibacteriota bacterium]MBU1729914.1 hypothetical protein [Candidatus Margulisiibacteriota bacterium]MBU1955947.1 hypothetical protein [Candidatus Margulisiibacteriota bacterium]
MSFNKITRLFTLLTLVFILGFSISVAPVFAEELEVKEMVSYTTSPDKPAENFQVDTNIRSAFYPWGENENLNFVVGANSCVVFLKDLRGVIVNENPDNLAIALTKIMGTDSKEEKVTTYTAAEELKDPSTDEDKDTYTKTIVNDTAYDRTEEEGEIYILTIYVNGNTVDHNIDTIKELKLTFIAGSKDGELTNSTDINRITGDTKETIELPAIFRYTISKNQWIEQGRNSTYSYGIDGNFDPENASLAAQFNIAIGEEKDVQVNDPLFLTSNGEDTIVVSSFVTYDEALKINNGYIAAYRKPTPDGTFTLAWEKTFTNIKDYKSFSSTVIREKLYLLVNEASASKIYAFNIVTGAVIESFTSDFEFTNAPTAVGNYVIYNTFDNNEKLAYLNWYTYDQTHFSAKLIDETTALGRVEQKVVCFAGVVPLMIDIHGNFAKVFEDGVDISLDGKLANCQLFTEAGDENIYFIGNMGTQPFLATLSLFNGSSVIFQTLNNPVVGAAHLNGQTAVAQQNYLSFHTNLYQTGGLSINLGQPIYIGNYVLALNPNLNQIAVINTYYPNTNLSLAIPNNTTPFNNHGQGSGFNQYAISLGSNTLIYVSQNSVNHAPTITITPASTSFMHDEEVVVDVYVTDPDSDPIQHVAYSGPSFGTLAKITANHYTVTFLTDVNPSSDLPLQYTIFAKDINGNDAAALGDCTLLNDPSIDPAGTVTYVYVYPEENDPNSSVTFTGTVGNDDWYVSDVTATVTAIDDSDLQMIYLQLGEGAIYAAVPDANNQAQFIIREQGEDVAVRVWASDINGNMETTPALADAALLDIDTVAPEIEGQIDGVDFENVKSLSIDTKVAANAYDATSGIVDISVRRDGYTVGDTAKILVAADVFVADETRMQSATIADSVNLLNLTGTDPEISVRAEDAAGNIAEIKATGTVALTAGVAIYPNPWDPTKEELKINFPINRTTASPVKIVVFDSVGKVVMTRVQTLASGAHDVTWNGQNSFGGRVESGLHIIKVYYADTLEYIGGEKLIVIYGN